MFKCVGWEKLSSVVHVVEVETYRSEVWAKVSNIDDADDDDDDYAQKNACSPRGYCNMGLQGNLLELQC